jgi:hypothetical protein
LKKREKSCERKNYEDVRRKKGNKRREKERKKKERMNENDLPETSFFFPRQAETSERWRPALHYICW